MYYVPTTDYACYTVYNQDTIRAYHVSPNEYTSVEYTDYFVNSHYLSKDGLQTFSSTIPVCLDSSNLTTDFFYRFDIVDIIILAIFLSFIFVYIPFKLIKIIFGRWLHV